MPAIALALLCALAIGCGGGEEAPTAGAACQVPADEVLTALERAPGAVTLAGETSISDCVTGSRNPGDLQTVGATLTEAAEELERTAPRDPRAALRLGYLIGAARRGSVGQIGITDELVRRLERAADLSAGTAAAQAALERGIAAGRARG
jgi:hypothetical protein